MARGALGVAVARLCARVVCGADGIVRAESAEVPRFAQVMPDAAPFLDKSTERSFAPGRARRKHHAGHVGAVLFRHAAVEALADGARRVAAFEADRREEQMGERMQQIEPDPGGTRPRLYGSREGTEELLGALHEPRASPSQARTEASSSSTKIPSPRTSAAGSHFSFPVGSVRTAGLTSRPSKSNSPWRFAPTESNRLKLTCTRTSRSSGTTTRPFTPFGRSHHLERQERGRPRTAPPGSDHNARAARAGLPLTSRSYSALLRGRSAVAAGGVVLGSYRRHDPRPRSALLMALRTATCSSGVAIVASSSAVVMFWTRAPHVLRTKSKAQRIRVGLRQSERADHLREVGVRSGPHQKLTLEIAALVRGSAAQPRTVAVAGEWQRRRAVHRVLNDSQFLRPQWTKIFAMSPSAFSSR